MSIWAVNWALNTDIANITHKFVLVALANFADDEDQAWPHVETLAIMSSTTKRTVYRALEALELDGWITRHPGFSYAERGGLRQVNSVYQLHLPETVTRRKGRGAGRPQVLRTVAAPAAPVDESPSGHRGDTSVTPI